jgi:hypothetical protein
VQEAIRHAIPAERSKKWHEVAVLEVLFERLYTGVNGVERRVVNLRELPSVIPFLAHV